MINDIQDSPDIYTERAFDSLCVWYDYLDKTYPYLRNQTFREIPEDTDKYAVYIDYRKHPYTEYSIRNVMNFLGPDWGLQLYIWPTNKKFIHSIVGDFKNIHIYMLSDNTLSPDKIMRHPGFWDSLKGEKLLIFDFDTVLRNENIEQFQNYDYVAPIWHPSKRPFPESIYGDGGLSIRNKKVMVDICKAHDSESEKFISESHFFSYYLNRDSGKYNLPTQDVIRQFATESVPGDDPFALHKPWTCLDPDDLAHLLHEINYK
jgi:hypothetical protein